MAADLSLLLDAYGPDPLEAAIKEAVQNQTPHVGAVRQVLEVQRKQRGAPPPVTVVPTDDPRMRDIVIKSPDLKTYDHLTENDDDDDTADGS